MVEHKAHFVPMAIDASDSAAKCRNQVVHGFKKDVGQYGSFQVAPQSFDQVQTWTVRRQPEDGDLIGVGGQPFSYRSRMVESAVVADQSDLATCVSGSQGDEKGQEVLTALGIGDGVGDLTGGVVHTAIHNLLLVLAGRRNFGLNSDGCPQTCQSRMAMNLHLVLKHQGFVGILFQGFFFKRRSCVLAFW
jgi:hypothetical protein